MIAMHYRFPLPADYDMAIIDRRIADKGHFTDGFPGLLFKAYLSARKRGATQDNAYAPFYVWETVAGMHAFLNGPGFAALSDAFGRPAVATWLVWHVARADGFAQARFAAIEHQAIPAGADLAALREHETGRVDAAVRSGHARAAVVAYDPQSWTLVRFRLLDTEPGEPAEPLAGAGASCRVYDVGHVPCAAGRESPSA